MTRAASAAEGQGEAISDGKASGTIEVWAMGTEGDVLGDFVVGLLRRQPRRRRQGDGHPVGGRARQDRQRDRLRRDPGRDPGRHDLDGRVRRERRHRPHARGPGRRGRLLRGRLGLHRGGRHVVRRPVVRRDPRPLLPHRPGQEGRLGRAPRQLGRAEAVRHRPAGQGRRRVRHQPPRRWRRLVADLHAVRVVQRGLAHQRGRHRVHDRLPGDDRGARVLQDVLRRRPVLDRPARRG